ncbi:MAG: DUF4332 domain-containing protein [Candidatus Hodarchaeales archaeon]
MKLIEIVGLEEKHAKKLEKEGIKSVDDLILLDDKKIRQLAKKTGISAKLLDEWQEHAELMGLDGVGPAYANALNKIGIDSVKELSRRNPKSTFTKIKEFAKENPDMIQELPTQKDVEGWIKQAKTLFSPVEPGPDVPVVPDGPGWTPKIPKKPAKPQKEKVDYGEYGQDYWNAKWVKQPIIYTGRALRGAAYNKQIDVDVKAFIKDNDEILNHVIKEAKLKKSTLNETAHACQKFVNDFLVYKFDEETADCVEFWQFPFETIQSGIGDCEDGAILIAALCINAGIPSWRIKCTGGTVLADITAPATDDSNLGGHGWCLYLADRADSERALEWVILDWCYLPDPQLNIEDKPLARDGGHENAYKEVWFTYNDLYSWAPEQIEITESRISNKRTVKKDDVVEVKEFLENMIKDIFKDHNIKME